MCIVFKAIIRRHLWVVGIGREILDVGGRQRRREEMGESYPNILAVIHRYWQVIHR